MTDISASVPGDVVMVSDLVLLSSSNLSALPDQSSRLFAFSEGILRSAVSMRDLKHDRTDISCCLFRIELNTAEKCGELGEEDKKIERKVNELKTMNAKETLRYGMSIRLRHLHTGFLLALDSLTPSQLPGSWPIIVDQHLAHASPHITLQTVDRTKRLGDDIKFGDKFKLTFQIDSLVFYSSYGELETGAPVLGSEKAGEWTFFRPMRKPVVEDAVELFSYVKLTHVELSMNLGAEESGKVALIPDDSRPTTIWQLEPAELTDTATPLHYTYLRNVATQKYLTADLTLSKSPIDAIKLEKDSENEETDESGGSNYSLQSQQTVHIDIGDMKIIAVKSGVIKANSLRKMIVAVRDASIPEPAIDLETTLNLSFVLKDVLFSIDNIDPQEGRELDMLGKTVESIFNLSEIYEEMITHPLPPINILSKLHSWRGDFARTLKWMQTFLDTATLENYSQRRSMLLWTGMHKALCKVCNLIIATKKKFPESNGLNLDLLGRIQLTEDLKALDSLLRNVIEFLSDVAKDSKEVAIGMMSTLPDFEELWDYHSKSMYGLISSVHLRVNPLSINGKVQSLSASKGLLESWVDTLQPMLFLSPKIAYHQAIVLLRLKVSCFDGSKFMPKIAEQILARLFAKNLLPLLTLCERDAQIYVQPAGISEENQLFPLEGTMEQDGYCEYLSNYLELISSLGRVYKESEFSVFGVTPALCVKLAKTCTLGNFAVCGLKLVSAFVLRRKPAVLSSDIVSTNCYYPSATPSPDDSKPILQFSACPLDFPGHSLVREIINWAASVFFSRSQFFDTEKTSLTQTVSYITGLLEIVKDLLQFGHATKFFFYAIDRVFCHFLLGFSDLVGKQESSWISTTIRKAVYGHIQGRNNVSKFVIMDCYKTIMEFGVYMNKIKRAFQLQGLAKAAFSSLGKEGFNWASEVQKAVNFPISAYIEKCKQCEGRPEPEAIREPFLSEDDPLFSLLNTSEIISNVPSLKQLLYRVAVICNPFSQSESNSIKLYVDSVYGEVGDIMHLLSKSELLEDQKYADEIRKVLDKRWLERLIEELETGDGETYSIETAINCQESLQQLCNMTHPDCFLHSLELDARRNIMRHLQVHRRVFRLWEIALTPTIESKLPELAKYCVQFCFNFTYNNPINARELKKFLNKPLFSYRIPQLADFLKSLKLYDALQSKEKRHSIEEIMDNLPKINNKSPQRLHSFYFLETFMYDFKGEPIKEVQTIVLRRILPIISSFLADLSACEDILPPFLRLLALTCDSNLSMSAAATALFTGDKFFSMVHYGSAKLVKSACDFFMYVWANAANKHEKELQTILNAAKSHLFAQNFGDLNVLMTVARENHCELLFTNPALMSINRLERDSDDLDALGLLGTRKSGLVAMILACFEADSGLNSCEIETKSLIADISAYIFQIRTALQSSPQNEIHSRGFASLLDSFLQRFCPENSEIPIASIKSLRFSSSLEELSPYGYQRYTQLTGQLIDSVHATLGHNENISEEILSALTISKEFDVRVTKKKATPGRSMLLNSRTFLRAMDDKRLYFSMVLQLLGSVSKAERVSLSKKIAIDAVKAIISSTLENKLGALNMLIGLYSHQANDLLHQFLEVLKKTELAGDLFRVLKEDLEEVTERQEALYRATAKANGVKPEQGSDELLKLECGMKILELLQVVCDLCNREFQLFLLSVPSEGRHSILYSVIKQFTRLNSLRPLLPKIPSSYSASMLSEYNSFRLSKTLMHLKFIRNKFSISEKLQQSEQPSAECQMSILSLAGLNTIIEMISGPCAETQRFISASVNIYLGFNELLEKAWAQGPCWELYNAGINALLIMMDGKVEKDNVGFLEKYLDLDMLLGHLVEMHKKATSVLNASSRDYLSTGTSVFMLLLKLLYLDYKPVDESRKFSLDSHSDFYQFFIRRVGCVEIAKEGEVLNEDREVVKVVNIECIYFPIPQKFQYMTIESKNELLFDVDRSSQQNQIHDFLYRTDIWMQEMDHQQRLNIIPGLKRVTKYWVYYGSVAYSIVVLVNMLLLLLEDDSGNLLGNMEGKDYLRKDVLALGIAQLAVSTLHIVCYVVEFFPNIFMRLGFSVTLRPFSVVPLKKNEQESHFKLLKLGYRLCMQSSFLYYIAYFVVSVMALTRPYLFPFLLLDIVQKSSDLVTILQSLTTNWSQLLLTLCLLLICIYIFAVFGYVYFRSFYPEDLLCQDFFECFMTTLSQGVQNGGGIGDSLGGVKWDEEMYWGRFAYDLTFFIIVIVVLLNVVFGIILDTFGELRDMRNARNEDIASTCYICGLTRSTLELKGSGWKYHLTGEHSPFAYLAFLIYLNDKHVDDCNGLEKYVKEKISKSDTTFVPSGTCKAMSEEPK